MHKRLLGLLASAAIVMAACGGATTTTAPPAASGPVASGDASAPPASGGLAAEQIVRIALPGEPPTLDPNAAQDANSLTVLRALHRPLVYIDKDLNVVDALAESHEISADAKTLTFHLRDAKYSNGDPIVAADLVYSWKRLVDPRTAAPYSYVMAEVAGAERAARHGGRRPCHPDAEIDAALDKLGVAAPDDKTFVVTLATPATYFLSAMTLWVGVPIQEKWITSEGATEAANYVSSGPFMLDTWDHNSQIILKPNPNWYGDVKPTLTEIQMPIFAEPAAAQAAYETNEVDIIMPVASDGCPRVQEDPVMGARVPVGSAALERLLQLQQRQRPDGQEAARSLRGPQGVPDGQQELPDRPDPGDRQAVLPRHDLRRPRRRSPTSFVQPGLGGYDESINPYPYDPEAAKASMDKALAELGFASAAEIPPLKFGFNTGGGHEPRVAFLAEAWRTTFGLETEQIGSEFGVFLTQRTAGEYDIARNGWGADYPHANNQLNGLFTCGGGNNDQQWCNEEFDSLLAQAAVEPDVAKQNELYVQAQTIMADEAASLFLLFPARPALVKPYVTGLTKTPMDSTAPGEHFYETMQILEH